MTDPTPFVIAGVATGALYALSATGLVLSYRISGILNLAHGAVGMLCAFVFFELHNAGVPIPVAFALAGLALPAVLAAVLDAVLLARLAGASVLARTAGTVAVLLALFGVGAYVWGGRAVSIPSVFPETVYRPFGSVTVSASQLGSTVAAIALGVALMVWLRRSALGLRIRAVVNAPGLAALRGIRRRRIERLGWTVAFSFSAVSGILVAPILGSNVANLTLLVVYALAAAALGGLRNIGVAMLGGIGLGLAQNLLVGYAPSSSSAIGQVRNSLPFVALMVVLVVRHRTFAEVGMTGHAGRHALVADLGTPVVRTRSAQARLTLLTCGLGTVIVVGVALFASSFWTYVATAAIVNGVIFLGFTVLTGTSGLVSLAQGTFAGIGAFTTAGLLEAGWPFPVALIVAAAVGAAGGLAVALPTARLRGTFLALGTLAFALMADTTFFNEPSITGGFAGRPVPRPTFFGLSLDGDAAFLLLAAASFAAVATLVNAVSRGGIGLQLRAMAASEKGAASIGIRRAPPRLIAFSLGAGVSAFGGALLAALIGHVSAQSFSVFASLQLLAVIAIAGVGSVAGALIAGIFGAVTPELTRLVPRLASVYPILFGVGALFALRVPGGTAGDLARRFRAMGRPVAAPFPVDERLRAAADRAMAAARGRRPPTVEAVSE